MQVNRRHFVEMFAFLGFISATPALAQTKIVQVSIKDTPSAVFDPPNVAIAVGDTVEWTNSGGITHSATFDPKQASKPADAALPTGVAAFDSGDLDQDATFKHTFTVKDTYKYFCKYHEEMGMVGTVIVS
jgi:plastocyanin